MEFGSPCDVAGTTSMWARLNAPDAVLLEQHIEAMARSVCAADPRSIGERRADALLALGAGTELACHCGQSDCAGASHDPPANNAMVYVVAEQTSVAAAQTDTQPSGPAWPAADPAEPITPADDPAGDPPEAADQCAGVTEPPSASAQAASSSRRRGAAPPAYMFGGGVLPTALLGGILERARIRAVRHPGADSSPDPRYTPTRATCEFVRCRDLTCRFPGCDKPAQFCDLDHNVPYPVGPTHPSNLKCLCRFHRRVMTFHEEMGVTICPGQEDYGAVGIQGIFSYKLTVHGLI